MIFFSMLFLRDVSEASSHVGGFFQCCISQDLDPRSPLKQDPEFKMWTEISSQEPCQGPIGENNPLGPSICITIHRN